MSKFKIAAISTLVFLAGVAVPSLRADAAFRYCSQPNAPSAFLTKPSMPYCVTSRTFSDWQIQGYQNDVDRYFDELRRYSRDVDDYYSEARDYIACMSELD